MKDPFHLQRFVDAQSGVIDRVYTELRAGQKRSHWMWFIFPQIRGLGSSRMAQEFAISSLIEATAYVAHPVLGPRLKASSELVNAIEGRSIKEILGYPDHLKFHSSMTLFARADPDEPVAVLRLGEPAALACCLPCRPARRLRAVALMTPITRIGAE